LKDLLDKARSYALKLLSYRARSEKELGERLMKKGIAEPEVSATICYLKDRGLVDDLVLAEAIEREAVSAKMLSRMGTRRYMLRRGIAPDIIDAVLQKDAYSDIDTARRLVTKKMRVLHAYPPETGKRRLYGFLSRRGYSSETITKVLNEMIDKKEVNER
jgi:regulatory protein